MMVLPAVRIEMAALRLSVSMKFNVLMSQLQEWELNVVLVQLDSLGMV